MFGLVITIRLTFANEFYFKLNRSSETLQVQVQHIDTIELKQELRVKENVSLATEAVICYRDIVLLRNSVIIENIASSVSCLRQ